MEETTKRDIKRNYIETSCFVTTEGKMLFLLTSYLSWGKDSVHIRHATLLFVIDYWNWATVGTKGTVSRDDWLQVFSLIFLPWAPSNSISDILLFPKICKDIRNSQCVTAVNDAGDESTTNLPAASLPPVSTTPVVTSPLAEIYIDGGDNVSRICHRCQPRHQ